MNHIKTSIFIGLMTSTLLFANVAKDNAQAVFFLDSGKYQQAYDLMLKHYLDGDYDNQSLFLLGMSAKETKRLPEAEMYLSELLDMEPDAQRTRLELASIQYQRGKLMASKKNLLIVKASNPPRRIGENIDEFLKVIEEGIPKTWSFSAGLGYLYDTNVNAAPDAESVLGIFGPGTQILDKDSQPREDSAITGKSSIVHNYLIDDSFGWQSQVAFNFINYNHIAEYSSRTFSLSSGPSWKWDDVSVSVPMVFTHMIMVNKEPWYMRTTGIAPQLGYGVTERTRIGLTLGYSKKDFYKQFDSQKDSTTKRLELSLLHAPTNTSFIKASVGWSYEDANEAYNTITTQRSDANSKSSQSISLVYYQALTKDISFYFTPVRIWTSHEEGDPFRSMEMRDDVLSMYSSSLSYTLPVWDESRLSAGYTYFQNNSSIDAYEYIRRQYMMMFIKSF